MVCRASEIASDSFEASGVQQHVAQGSLKDALDVALAVLIQGAQHRFLQCANVEAAVLSCVGLEECPISLNWVEFTVELWEKEAKVA